MAYIDKELFEQDIKMRYCNNCARPNEIKCRACHVDDMLGEIEDAPTADVVEVKHSRWENISGFDVCNICGTSPAYCEPEPNNPKGYPPYCHNCGAKMDGRRDT